MSKIKNIKRSVSFTAETIKQLETIAAKKGIPTSSVIREFIDRGLTLETSKSDIDFIRSQIREELEIALDPRINRIIKLLIKQGIMIYPMAYYNAMLGAAMSSRNNINYHQMLEDSKKKGAAYLGVASDAVDLAFEEMMNFK